MGVDLTLVLSNYNALDAVALTLESFRYYHPDVEYMVYAIDNGSTDGAKEYLFHNADVVCHKDNSLPHGDNLSKLCSMVFTPYTMTLDNDMEFKAPVYEKMKAYFDDPDVYLVCRDRGEPKPFGYADIMGDGVQYECEWSPDISCGLYRTSQLQHLLQYVNLGYYMQRSTKQFFETGAMHYRMAMCKGWKLVQLPELNFDVHHYGQISCLWHDPHYPNLDKSSESTRIRHERYEIIRSRLAELREKETHAWGKPQSVTVFKEAR